VLVAQLAQGIAEKNDTSAAGKLVVTIASKTGANDAQKRAVLDTLAKSLKAAPEMSPEISGALQKLLIGENGEAVLPLAAKWDKAGALKDSVAKLTGNLAITLNDDKADPAARLAAAQRLIGLRSAMQGALEMVTKQLTREGAGGLKRDIITALGETADPSVGQALTAAFSKLPPEAQGAAFDAILKRSEWVTTFLDAAKAKQVDVTGLGPANLNRLRTHPDAAVSKRATELLDELNPMAKAKNEAIAKLSTVVEQPGNAAKGKELFTTACATCHNFGGAGADIGPGLTGMGSHGPSELLTAIVDPNREVDPSFVQWNIETKDGQSYAGIVARENPATVLMKSLAGQQEVKTADIKSRVNTGRSLMPEGFEGLGGEALRDIIAYMQSVDGARFRTLDLRGAYTASTSQGLYNSQAIKQESLVFVKTGTVNVGGIPFNIVGPEKTGNGRNVIVLKGGPPNSFSQTLPQRVDIKVGGFKANRLHILGGVTGWGYQPGGDTNDVLSITVHTTQGQRETIVCRNGVEFADYINRIDVPGSKFAEGIVREHQVRWFTKQLAQPVEIDRITLESMDRGAVPTTVAITAELADPNSAPVPAANAAPAAPAKPAAAAATPTDTPFVPQFSDPVPQPPAKANGPRVLLVGGGSSHDFVKYYGGTDKATLAPHVGWVDFTQNANGVPAIMKDLDVLVWSANQPIADSTAKALTEWVEAGKPLVLLHPGTWYLWKNFPEWNSKIVGGGARGHDNFGEFEVTLENRAHPVTAGVTERFKITDELYNFIPDPAGTPIEVLATATSPKTNKTFPPSVPREASEGPDRRDHSWPRRESARSAGVSEAPQAGRALGCWQDSGRVALNASAVLSVGTGCSRCDREHPALRSR
jgi:putative heme-binding domain-containing protein